MKYWIFIASCIILLGFFAPGVLFGEAQPPPSAKDKIIFDELHPCTLVMEEPYYNCNRPLRIVLFEGEFVPGYSSKYDDFFYPDYPVLGWAYFERVSLASGIDGKFDLLIFAEDSMNSKMGKWGGPLDLTTFQHEVAHIKCHCNWHLWLDRLNLHPNYRMH